MRTRLLLLAMSFLTSTAFFVSSAATAGAARPICPFVPQGNSCTITCPPNATQWCQSFFGHFGCQATGGQCMGIDYNQCPPEPQYNGCTCCEASTGFGCGAPPGEGCGFPPYCVSKHMVCDLIQA